MLSDVMEPQMQGRIVFTIFYGLVGWHCWAGSASIAKFLSEFQRMAAECLRPRPRAPATGPEVGEDEAWVRAQMDKVRVQQCRFVVRIGKLMTGLSASIMSLCWLTSVAIVPNFLPLGVVMVMLYAVFSIFDGRCESWLVLYPRAVSTLIHIFLLARIVTAAPSLFFYIPMGPRAIIRAITGVCILDHRLSWVLNVAWFLCLCRHQIYKQSSLPHSQGSVNSVWFVVSELITTILVQSLVFVYQEFAESNIRLRLGMTEARNVQQAVRRLLCVLCDAEMYLTPSFKIHDPSRKVAHLLAPGKESMRETPLEGRPFVDFIAEADQSRFRSFMPSTSAGTGDASVLPATSIHLHLCNNTGVTFPVEIFHAGLPCLETGSQLGHLIGIRECGLSAKEVSIPAEPRGQTPQPQLSVPSSTPQVDWRLRSPSSAASSASNNTVVRDSDWPELSQVNVRFDAMDETLTIRELSLSFKAADDPDRLPQLPHLRDWIHKSFRDPLKDWVQEIVNAEFNDREFAQPFGPLLMRWPLDGRQKGDLWLEASSLELDICESDGDEDPEQAEGDQDDEELPVVLKLKRFRQLQVLRGHERRPGSERSRRSRPGSVRSARSAGNNLRQLYAIPEAHLRSGAAPGEENERGGATAAESAPVIPEALEVLGAVLPGPASEVAAQERGEAGARQSEAANNSQGPSGATAAKSAPVGSGTPESLEVPGAALPGPGPEVAARENGEAGARQSAAENNSQGPSGATAAKSAPVGSGAPESLEVPGAAVPGTGPEVAARENGEAGARQSEAENHSQGPSGAGHGGGACEA